MLRINLDEFSQKLKNIHLEPNKKYSYKKSVYTHRLIFRLVGEWSTWATCSASCGTFGVIRRTRACLPGDGSTCNAILEQKKSCPPAPCSGENFYLMTF